ncbi:MAG: gliding motility-associated C-terminal domain-containing protein [Flavobacteriaceae bacterium]
MKSIWFIAIGFLSLGLFGQEAVHNYGNLKLHDDGMVGFHTNLVNDGSFDENLGLIGFYRSKGGLTISGAFAPSFFDFETAVVGDLDLEVSINIDNSLNFIYGDIDTPRENKNIYARLSSEAIYNGEMNRSKIDGLAAVEGQKYFIFPVGYGNLLRPLKLTFLDGAFFAKCQYLDENTDFPASFSEGFDTEKKAADLGAINAGEFWNMTTTGMIQIALGWNADKSLPQGINELQSVTVAGWHKTNGRWDNLGNSSVEGTLDEGWVTSKSFNANDYEIFSLGSFFDYKSKEPDNYFMSPNGDGINDFFVIDLLEKPSNNSFKIFNRDGLLVYEKENYQNDFRGYSNQITNKNNLMLPPGVYFYLLDMHDTDLEYQGYFYLTD